MSDVRKLNRMLAAGKFANYIECITFPFFKNIAENAHISFDFPLTVLVGKNGSGKSSVLKALYGAPEGYSCGDYWFSTALDPIVEAGADKKRNCFFYAYMETKGGKSKEVLKQRIKRDNNPDYWETSAPVSKYGMKKGTRNAPVKKQVVYIDFRTEISAFDKCFNFFNFKNETKQKYLRRKAIPVNDIFRKRIPRLNGNYIGTVYEPVRTLHLEMVKEINLILGKSYSKITIMRHRLYADWGTSIVVEIPDGPKYSEANAGSGEVAVIQMVYKIMNAPEYSLILLDEPEISLHPAAQEKLQLFLLRQAKEKKHQIVISTHSPKLLEGLPVGAIKLFHPNSVKKFDIQNHITFNEAFFDISDSAHHQATIYCEDIAAKILLEKITHSMKKKQFFKIIFCPGGAESIIKKYVPVFSEGNQQPTCFFFLDGDKFKECCDLSVCSAGEMGDVTFLMSKSKAAYDVDIPVYIDGHKGHGDKEQKLNAYKRYINFHKDRVYYLPERKLPEDIILDSQYVIGNYAKILEDNSFSTSKDKLLRISNERGDGSLEITISALATEWLHNESDDYTAIKCDLQKIYDACTS